MSRACAAARQCLAMSSYDRRTRDRYRQVVTGVTGVARPRRPDRSPAGWLGVARRRGRPGAGRRRTRPRQPPSRPSSRRSAAPNAAEAASRTRASRAAARHPGDHRGTSPATRCSTSDPGPGGTVSSSVSSGSGSVGPGTRRRHPRRPRHRRRSRPRPRAAGPDADPRPSQTCGAPGLRDLRLPRRTPRRGAPRRALRITADRGRGRRRDLQPVPRDSDLARVNARAGPLGRGRPAAGRRPSSRRASGRGRHGRAGAPAAGPAPGALGYDRDFALSSRETRPRRPTSPAPRRRRLARDRARPTARVRIPAGTALDLGSTAKAWAADLVAAGARAASSASRHWSASAATSASPHPTAIRGGWLSRSSRATSASDPQPRRPRPRAGWRRRAPASAAGRAAASPPPPARPPHRASRLRRCGAPSPPPVRPAWPPTPPPPPRSSSATRPCPGSTAMASTARLVAADGRVHATGELAARQPNGGRSCMTEGPLLWYLNRGTGVGRRSCCSRSPSVLGRAVAGRPAGAPGAALRHPGAAPQRRSARVRDARRARRLGRGRRVRRHPLVAGVRAGRRDVRAAVAGPRRGRARPAAGDRGDQPAAATGWRHRTWRAAAPARPGRCGASRSRTAIGMGTDLRNGSVAGDRRLRRRRCGRPRLAPGAPRARAGPPRSEPDPNPNCRPYPS